MTQSQETFNIGKLAPDFSLSASNGDEVSLRDYRGKFVVLYFYPKDNTPGCTSEACDFREYYHEFNNLDAIIIGISPDPVKSHNKFIEKYRLPFLLLSDEEHRVSEVYGTWVLKKMYGREYMGIERSTFLIDKEGKILKIFRKVKVKGHVEATLNYLKSIGN